MASKNDSYEFSLPTNPLPVHMQECRLRKRFTDMTLRLGEEEYPAHKIVLEGSSPVLKAWIADHWKVENDVHELSEQFVDSEIVEDLLTFFYTAKVIITAENAHAFCMASHYLNITPLLEASEKYLSKRVISENVLDLFLLADKLKLETLRKKCVDCLVENCEVVLKDNRIVSYSFEDLKLLITQINDKNDDLKLREALFECLMNWVEYDSSVRSSSLPSLLRSLPLTGLSQQFLSDVVANQNVISESIICLRLLNDAFKVACKTLQQSTRVQSSFKLYCFGGRNEKGKLLSSVSCLDVSTGVWNAVTPMLTPRSSFGGAIIGKKIYLCGGWVDNSTRSNTVEVYDCTSNTTTPLRQLPQPRSHCAAASLNGFVYVSGGRDDSGRTSSVLRYNPQTDQWQEVKAMQNERSSHQMVSLNDRLYAISGYNTNTVESYNPTTDQWTMMDSTQHIHKFSGAAVHEGKIYVCSSEGLEVYSPDTETWQTLTPPNKHQGMGLVSMNGKLWALGGNEIGARGSSAASSYDITTGNWTPEQNMNASYIYHRSFVVPN